MPMSMPSAANFNLNITSVCTEGRVKETLHTLLTTINPPVDSNTYLQLLQTCIAENALSQGKRIHSLIIHREFAVATRTTFQNKLTYMYDKCGCLVDARKVFDDMTERDVSSWNIIIAAYRGHGYPQQALTLFHQMQRRGGQPDRFTFASILPACAKIRALKQGMDIHQSIIERGFLSDVVVANALVDMYIKCGSIHNARKLFDKMSQKNVISWTAMIAGYAQKGVLDEALTLFKEMPQRNVVSWTAMITGCAQNGFLNDAFWLFKEMPQKNVVSWNAMIAGYAHIELAEKAVEAFKQMQLSDIKPDSTTFVSVLPACTKMGALGQGMDIHRSIIESRLLLDVVVASALVDMYAKCGSVHKAREVFDKMPQKDVFLWTTMIAGYAQNGFCKDALELFEIMKHSGTHPDHASFVCVLLACSHAGLVDDGCKYFNSISDSYCTTPTIDHYVCMVDILGRAGYLEETLNFIIKMPVKPRVVVWMCLLGACRAHKNIGLGAFTATLLFELDPQNAATYVQLSNIYAEVGRWCEVQMLRRLMKDRGIKKIPGCSWI